MSRRNILLAVLVVIAFMSTLALFGYHSEVSAEIEEFTRHTSITLLLESPGGVVLLDGGNVVVETNSDRATVFLEVAVSAPRKLELTLKVLDAEFAGVDRVKLDLEPGVYEIPVSAVCRGGPYTVTANTTLTVHVVQGTRATVEPARVAIPLAPRVERPRPVEELILVLIIGGISGVIFSLGIMIVDKKVAENPSTPSSDDGIWGEY